MIVSMLLPALGGCGVLMSRAAERVATDLRTAIINHNDPQTVRDGAPAWLLMTDALAAGDPDNPVLQAQAAQLYAAYSGGFTAGDPERAKRLSTRARDYGRAALCAHRDDACDLFGVLFEVFESRVDGFGEADVAPMYASAVGELAYIQAHSDDWSAIADLPRAQALLERVVALQPAFEHGSAQAFLGVLHSLRPPALGGDPEAGRAYFESALAHSGGRDLMTKVLYAEHYARVTYDRELHDRLLAEVVAADPAAEGFTLSNVMAQRRARDLMAGSSEYFFEE